MIDMKQMLINGNKRFVEDINNSDDKKEVHNSLKNGQKPIILIICCSDSRVVPEYIFDMYFGELFVIRTAGNVINEGELASIEYGLEHLKIKYVLVMGHTSCGAVHASIHNEQGKYLDPILKRIKRNIGNECLEKEASIANAKSEADYLKEKFSYLNDVKFEYGLYDLSSNECKIF